MVVVPQTATTSRSTWKFCHFSFWVVVLTWFYLFKITKAFFGKSSTWNAALAGMSFWKNFAYSSLTVGKSLMSLSSTLTFTTSLTKTSIKLDQCKVYGSTELPSSLTLILAVLFAHYWKPIKKEDVGDLWCFWDSVLSIIVNIKKAYMIFFTHLINETELIIITLCNIDLFDVDV